MSYSSNVTEMLLKIVSFNHCWKMAQQRHGNNSAIARMLRDQKSVLQAALLRQNLAYLKPDPDAEEEPLFSVRIHQPVTLNGVVRIDAEHMPVRLAEEFFTNQELNNFIGE